MAAFRNDRAFGADTLGARLTFVLGAASLAVRAEENGEVFPAAPCCFLPLPVVGVEVDGPIAVPQR